MTARTLQICLSLIFFLLGSWCLFFPGMVIEVTFRPEYATASDQARFIMGCFGAQAVLTGTIIWTARFTPTTFLVFGYGVHCGSLGHRAESVICFGGSPRRSLNAPPNYRRTP
jgi:hypothetical protein